MSNNFNIITNSSQFNDTYNCFNVSESESDIHTFVREYKECIHNQLLLQDCGKSQFVSFSALTEKRLSVTDLQWIQENEERFFKNTNNGYLVKLDYLSELGFICCMTYSPDGKYVIVGYSTGLIQIIKSSMSRYKMDSNQKLILTEFSKYLLSCYDNEKSPHVKYPMFYRGKIRESDYSTWIKENYNTFLKGTMNEISYNRWYYSECGAISSLAYSPLGTHIIVGHLSGLIQMRHGGTGSVMCTLRNIQFPPKPVYAILYSRLEERVCYAACMDGAVYRIEIPNITASLDDPPKYCIRADPGLEYLNIQFYGTPGISSYLTPFVNQRSPALSLGLTADQTKLVAGYADTSIKVYDMETKEAILAYKVHKQRLQFIPKKLQRMHSGQVCALRCHDQQPFTFASAAWDQTLRIWDTRCKIGCVMTFEGVDVCSDSIDLNRDQCITGSWKPTEALAVWDLVARKRLNIIRVQNRRPNVDGEYIYACRYWRSTKYNRKGKYAIIGGSGTNAVEVINLHNRYIACSYPAAGTILAVTSHENRIAYGGTAPVFNIVTFHDPKHEKFEACADSDNKYNNDISVFHDEDNIICSRD